MAAPILLVGVLFWGLASSRGAPRVGEQLPGFTLPTFKGEQVAIGDFRGKPLLINFWASWCLPCKDEAPALAAAHRGFVGTDLVMIGIDTEDTLDDARAFLARYDIGYLNLRDTTGRVSRGMFGVRAYPETFFVGRDGTIVAHVFGPMTKGEIASRITTLLDSDGGR